MEAFINITTDEAGKKLYDACLETCERHAGELDLIYKWLTDIEKFENLEHEIKTGQNFSTVKNLYQLQALFIIASTDIAVITSQMYLTKNKFQHLFFNRQLNLTIYEAHGTYSSHKQFLQALIASKYPHFNSVFTQINQEERIFVRKFNIKTIVMEIRNKVGGHIHKDFKEWYQTVNILDGEKDAQMTIAFMNLFTKIFNLTTTLTNLEHQGFIDYEQKSRTNLENYIQKIQDLMVKENKKLSADQKLNFDLQKIRDLL